MYSLSKTTPGGWKNTGTMEESEKLSVYYHDLFDFPLTFPELIKWNTSIDFPAGHHEIQVICRNDYFFLRGREGLIYKRNLKNRNSANKFKIARKASKALSLIPTVKMIAVTGSLAMNNAADKSDIDLMIITKKGTLWTTRLLAYLLLFILGYSLRSPKNKSQKDKLCLNMWMDESDLVWSKRNPYTAHEIAQILPLVNKKRTYEKFLFKNRWILKFWPNAVRISEVQKANGEKVFPLALIEKIAFLLQYQHMRSKITREVVTETRAIFHPLDWGSRVISRLSS